MRSQLAAAHVCSRDNIGLPAGGTHVPNKIVDEKVFNALHIAQATINYTRSTLRYGSANQASDLKKLRLAATPANGQSIDRVKATRDGVKQILARPHRKSPELTDDLFRQGVSAGVAAYYRAGNCGEHATVAFCYLAHFGYPGLKIEKVSSKLMDHAFVLVSPASGSSFTVVCDPWPSKAQAVLWEDHFCYRDYDAYTVIASYTIDEQNMGYDPMTESFQAIDPSEVSVLRPEDKIAGYTEKAIDDYIKNQLGHGLYNHEYTTQSGAFQDYENGTEKLSTILGDNEQWTAKLEPMLKNTIDPMGTKVGLNPKLKFL
jgi:hypothetical protein